MKFLRNLLGIGTLEEKLEEVYLHCVRANAQTHSSLFEQKDMLKTLIDSEAEKTFKPQIWSSFGHFTRKTSCSTLQVVCGISCMET